MNAFERTLWALPLNLGQTLEHLFAYWYQVLVEDDLVWRRFRLKIDDLQSQETADDQYTSWDVVNWTGGNIDGSWTESDYQAVTDALGGLCSTMAPYLATKYRFAQLDAYVMSFNPAWAGSSPTDKIHPFNISGGPDYSRVVGINGADSSGALPPQVSTSVTEIVPRRPNWGRAYWPGPAKNRVESVTGRFTPTYVGTLAQAFHTAYLALANAEFYVCVPTTQSAKQRVVALQNVTNVRVDDIPDVVRRRRFRFPIYSETEPPIASSSVEQLPAER